MSWPLSPTCYHTLAKSLASGKSKFAFPYNPRYKPTANKYNPFPISFSHFSEVPEPQCQESRFCGIEV